MPRHSVTNNLGHYLSLRWSLKWLSSVKSTTIVFQLMPCCGTYQVHGGPYIHGVAANTGWPSVLPMLFLPDGSISHNYSALVHLISSELSNHLEHEGCKYHNLVLLQSPLKCIVTPQQNPQVTAESAGQNESKTLMYAWLTWCQWLMVCWDARCGCSIVAG